jgi:hypothetical protein
MLACVGVMKHQSRAAAGTLLNPCDPSDLRKILERSHDPLGGQLAEVLGLTRRDETAPLTFRICHAKPVETFSVRSTGRWDTVYSHSVRSLEGGRLSRGVDINRRHSSISATALV